MTNDTKIAVFTNGINERLDKKKNVVQKITDSWHWRE